MARFTRKKKDPDPPDTNDLVTELKLKKVMPAVPLRDIVVFPGMVVPLLIGRQKTINAVEEAQSQTKNLLVLVFQTHPETEDPRHQGTDPDRDAGPHHPGGPPARGAAETPGGVAPAGAPG